MPDAAALRRSSAAPLANGWSTGGTSDPITPDTFKLSDS